MDILELLAGQLGQKGVVETLSKSVGADKDQVQNLAAIAIPTLIQAMNKNAQTEKGANSLLNALDQHSEDKVGNVNNFLKGVDLEDGAKILGHLLGNNSKTVEKQLAKQSGMDVAQVSKLLITLAPLLMGILGNQKKQQAQTEKTQSSSILDMLGASSNNPMMSMVTGILDADGDGDIMDDLGGLLGSFFKK